MVNTNTPPPSSDAVLAMAQVAPIGGQGWAVAGAVGRGQMRPPASAPAPLRQWSAGGWGVTGVRLLAGRHRLYGRGAI